MDVSSLCLLLLFSIVVVVGVIIGADVCCSMLLLFSGMDVDAVVTVVVVDVLC